MKASDLNEIIKIYNQTVTRTTSGAADIDYTLKYTCRARVNFASGSRTVDNEEIFYSVDRTFIVRRYVPVVDTDIIEWQDKKWQIRSIDHSREYDNIMIQTTLINE